MTEFTVGDYVEWHTDLGAVRGVISKVYTADVSHSGFVHHATLENPQYSIKIDNTWNSILRKGSALRRIPKSSNYTDWREVA